MCQICGKPVDRSEMYVSVVWSPEFIDREGCIQPVGADELILFHGSCAPNREGFRRRISYL